jgi:hypothetical protein
MGFCCRAFLVPFPWLTQHTVMRLFFYDIVTLTAHTLPKFFGTQFGPK